MNSTLGRARGWFIANMYFCSAEETNMCKKSGKNKRPEKYCT